MKVEAFRGLRPRKDLAARIPCPPYDVLDREEATALARDNPYTLLRVTRPEVDLGPEVEPTDDRVYTLARERFREMIDRGWLSWDAEPAFYVYRLEAGGHLQTGIVALASLDDYLEGRIRKHELTRADKEEDRARHIEALSAHVGPVLLGYRRVPATAEVTREVAARIPEVDFAAPDGVRHRLWIASDRAARRELEELFSGVPCAYIADGHHRAAAAARAALRSRPPRRPRGNESHHRFLAALFPSDELRVLDYNRLVRDLNGLTPESFLERARRAGFEIVEEHHARRPPHRRSFGMYLRGRWYLLTALGQQPGGDNPSRSLDAALLAERLLGPVLGIGDPRTDPRIGFAGGLRGMEELERRVDSGQYEVAFAVHAVCMEEVMSVADAGGIMPPKTTWFEPKLRSGMVIHTFDSEPTD
jgi:uncharacterized protein (DUF1015 family)